MMMTLSKDQVLARAIRKARERLGENQQQFASRLRINQATVSRWENAGPSTPMARLYIEQFLADLDRLSPAAAR